MDSAACRTTVDVTVGDGVAAVAVFGGVEVAVGREVAVDVGGSVGVDLFLFDPVFGQGIGPVAPMQVFAAACPGCRKPSTPITRSTTIKLRPIYLPAFMLFPPEVLAR